MVFGDLGMVIAQAPVLGGQEPGQQSCGRHDVGAGRRDTREGANGGGGARWAVVESRAGIMVRTDQRWPMLPTASTGREGLMAGSPCVGTAAARASQLGALMPSVVGA